MRLLFIRLHPKGAAATALLSALLLVACPKGQSADEAAGGSGGTTSSAAMGGGGSGGASTAEVCDPFGPRPTPPEVLIGPTGLEQALVAQMDQAQNEILLTMYQLTTSGCIQGLIDAHERGVSVRVLLDFEQTENDSAISQLSNAGVSVQATPAEFKHAHAKAMIIDGVRAVVMSANMNVYSMNSERNYGVIDHDPQDVEDLTELFERDWAGQGTLDVACTRLIVGPENARERTLALIDSAEQSLDLAVMYLSDDEVMAAVKAKAQGGVPVRVMLADPGWISNNTATAAELDAAGVDARILSAWELHAKLIIADGVALVGSENMSWTSLTKNREVGLFITEPGPAGQIAVQYEQDWAQAIQN